MYLRRHQTGIVSLNSIQFYRWGMWEGRVKPPQATNASSRWRPSDTERLWWIIITSWNRRWKWLCSLTIKTVTIIFDILRIEKLLSILITQASSIADFLCQSDGTTLVFLIAFLNYTRNKSSVIAWMYRYAAIPRSIICTRNWGSKLLNRSSREQNILLNEDSPARKKKVKWRKQSLRWRKPLKVRPIFSNRGAHLGAVCIPWNSQDIRHRK